MHAFQHISSAYLPRIIHTLSFGTAAAEVLLHPHRVVILNMAASTTQNYMIRKDLLCLVADQAKKGLRM
jgi:hypothetical protein